jgi:hypothetical protein
MREIFPIRSARAFQKCVDGRVSSYASLSRDGLSEALASTVVNSPQENLSNVQDQNLAVHLIDL